jgi:[ribosomal protein S5]-alanine N-acetyltransferase
MKKITIETDRLCLKPFSERHIDDRFVSWLNDKNVMRFSDQRHVTHTKDSCMKYLDTFDGSSNHYWAIELKGESSRCIGSLTAYVDENNSVANVGIMIGDMAVWGEGFGKEAFLSIVTWLSNVKKIRKVMAGTMGINVAMLKVMSSVGMQEECRLKDYYIVDGQLADLVYTSL